MPDRPTHLHIDCFSGISGDMMLAALLDAGVPEEAVRKAVDSLGLPGTLHVEKVRKNGFAATRITVETADGKKHRHLPDILKLLDGADMTAGARGRAVAMFERLADAEAHSHGIDRSKVHFHEVGAVDSLFDFVGIAVGLDWLDPTRVTCRPVPTGHGFVECDHGRLPVPAPATVHLLRGVPLASSEVASELTTPTGAAVVATAVHSFAAGPEMVVRTTGLGAGTRDFPQQPNLLRLLVGDVLPAGVAEAGATADDAQTADTVVKLETNLDDVTGEVLGHAVTRLLAAGALDAFTQGVQMKKQRPGTLVTVLCRESDRVALEGILFAETGTLGIRRVAMRRSKQPRRSEEVQTLWGPARVKVVGAGDAVTAEHDDCVRIADRHGLPLRTVAEAVRSAYHA